MMTDKIILCFTFIVTVGVAFIIIYSVVKPDQETFNVPDELKPPTPGYGADTDAPTPAPAATSSADPTPRLLRGFSVASVFGGL
jgi:hypothetical protein